MASTSERAQASEVHETTADASSSPEGTGDAQATRDAAGHGHSLSRDAKVRPEAGELRIVSEQSDDGGPIEIRSVNPDENSKPQGER